MNNKMKKRYLHSLGLILLVFVSFCNRKSEKETIPKTIEIDERPERSNDENIKLICFLAMFDFANSKVKIKHMGERLISIDENILDRGDSISYDFNSSNQLVQEEVYTNEGKLKEKIHFQNNPSKQLEEISSRNFDGGSPMTIRYIYNKLNQIIEERGSNRYSYKRFQYDTKNYLSQEETIIYKDSLLKTTCYFYDNLGNLTSILTKSNAKDTISMTLYKYNELKQIIEREHRGEQMNCAGRNKWNLKYNEFGDEIEEKTHDLTIHYKYVYDKHKNWIKQYSFYNEDKSPNFLITREIKYFK